MEQIILFVDDEPAILKSMKRTFRKLPYKILTASNAVEALQIIEHTPVSVLISDYTMPGRSGAELLSAAKTLRPEMVRIILSGNNDQSSVIEAMNDGEAFRFLSKPWDDSSLIDHVEGALAAWKSQVYLDFDKLLLNKQAFQRIAELQLLENPLDELSLVVMALRNNETLEHSLGAEGVSELLLSCTPEPDGSLEGVTFGVLDNEYLCFLLRPLADATKFQSKIRNIVDKYSRQYSYDDQQYSISFAVGYVVMSSTDGDASSLFENALIALEHSRKNLSDTPIAFQESMRVSNTRRNILDNNLHKALDRGEFELHYQPKIDISNNTLHGAEALIRWNNPILGSVSPFDFIPLAEHNGSINDIGEWVLNEAISQWCNWFRLTNLCPRISVNVSPHQLKEDLFISRLENALSAHNIEPSMLELEITESLMIDDVEKTLKQLQEIKKLGLKLSIDDFGTGYSSLSYLSRLPVDIIKIDRSFIFPMLESSSKRNLVNNLIKLGHDLGMEIVAEGVEDSEQLEVLQEFGCDVFQGYYFSPPVAANVFLETTKAITPEVDSLQQICAAS